MILNNYDSYLDVLSDILSLAYKYKYSLAAVESRITKSFYFQTLVKNVDDPSLYKNKDLLIKEFFYDLPYKINLVDKYNECYWASEAYLKIISKTGCTFEVVFLYIPIEEMYNYFPIYHEMDFDQIINRFKELFIHKSIIHKASKRLGYSLLDISKETDIPYPTLAALSTRKRDIRNLNGISLYKLSQALHIQIESLLCDAKG